MTLFLTFSKRFQGENLMKNLNIIVETYDHNTPLSDVHILMIFPNNTPATAKSDQFGEAELYLYTFR